MGNIHDFFLRLRKRCCMTALDENHFYFWKWRREVQKMMKISLALCFCPSPMILKYSFLFYSALISHHVRNLGLCSWRSRMAGSGGLTAIPFCTRQFVNLLIFIYLFTYYLYSPNYSILTLLTTRSYDKHDTKTNYTGEIPGSLANILRKMRRKWSSASFSCLLPDCTVFLFYS